MLMYTKLIKGTKSQKNCSKRDCRWNEVKRCCFGCMLGYIKTSDINKHLTIASSSSCPNTRDSFTAQNCVWVCRVGAGGHWSLSITYFQPCGCEWTQRAGKGDWIFYGLTSGPSINDDLQLWMCPWVPHNSGRMGWPAFGSLRQLLFSPDLLFRTMQIACSPPNVTVGHY